MKSLSIVILCATVLGVCALGRTGAATEEQKGYPPPGFIAVENLDAALDAVVSSEAKLELVAGVPMGDHFGATEGPVWVQAKPSGYLLFSDMQANVIYKLAGGQVSVFLEKSGYTGNDLLNAGAQSTSGRLATLLVGSNGLTVDSQARLIICAQTDRTMTRLERDGTRTLLADRYEGKRFNGPNDVVVKSNGSVYFTDTPAGMRGRDKSPFKELEFDGGVFLIKDGKVTLVEKGPERGAAPNGIALSADERTLYVGSGGNVNRYDIQADDTLANQRLVIDAITDGMKVDPKGNLYITPCRRFWGRFPRASRLVTMMRRVSTLRPGRTCTTSGSTLPAICRVLAHSYLTAGARTAKERANASGSVGSAAGDSPSR